MSGKRAILIGDQTDHGGRVIEGDEFFSVSGKKVACLGHKVSCPKCKGIYPIIEGVDNVFINKKISVEGMRTACGARLIASQKEFFIGDDNVSRNVLNRKSFQGDKKLYISVLDSDSGKVMSNSRVIVVINGVENENITDINGKIAISKLNKGDEVIVHVLHKSPKRFLNKKGG